MRDPGIALLALGVIAYEGSDAYECTPDESLALYSARVEPLLTDDRPKTCNQCHLSGVDLSLFLQDTPCATMACMVEQDLVDLAAPERSLVLTWIERADPASELITDGVIRGEYDAVLEWIRYHANCGEAVCDPVENACGAPPTADDCELPKGSQEPRPFEDPGDCSDKTLELVFREKLYAWRGRCYACHFDHYDGEPEDAPRWVATGDCDGASLATLRNLEASGYLDLVEPTQSLLLLKPLAEESGGLIHGGHNKFASTDDPAYVDFLYFIERYAVCRS